MYQEISSNKRKTLIMMAVFLVLVVGLSWIFAKFVGSSSITVYVLIGALIYALISYVAGSRLALAVSGAKEIVKADNPTLFRTVENLSITEGIPTPRIYVIDDPAPNAFATGRDPKNSSVAVTTGLLDIMDKQELEGVIAHELGHIRNYDIRVSMMAFALVAAVGLLADMMLRLSWFGGGDDDNDNQLFFILGIVAAILAPIVASLIQLSISRKREYLADATGALTTRYPEGLASALQKIEAHGSVMKRQNTSTAHLFFSNPLKAKGVMNLFSTHPPLEDRIARLRQMDKHA